MVEHSVPSPRRTATVPNGFSLPEVMVATVIVCALSALTVPTFISCYDRCCLTATVDEITGMIREAKQNALINGRYYSISFNTGTGRVALISGKGRDGTWGTSDDPVVRSFRLTDKGGGLSFGYGTCGPLPTLAATADGVSFQNNNTLICNPDLKGTAGVAYLISRSGSAMAIKMNSTDFGYTLWRWGGKKWVRL